MDWKILIPFDFVKLVPKLFQLCFRPSQNSIAGIWAVLYAEPASSLKKFKIIEEILYIKQGWKKTIQGEYVSNEDKNQDSFNMEGEFDGNMITGNYYAPSRKNVQGKGVFHLIVNGALSRCDGYCTWLSSDMKGNPRIECSKAIWTKRGNANSADLFKSAKAEMEETYTT